MRRRLVRGLRYLQTGIDLDGRKQEASGRPLISDPQQKIAAEMHIVPLSSRFIYALLMMSCSNRRVYSTTFWLQGTSLEYWAVAARFETESNAEVAKLAMAQETWLERLCVAFCIFGRADAADEGIAEVFRYLASTNT